MRAREPPTCSTRDVFPNDLSNVDLANVHATAPGHSLPV
ncbi:hypothetical protein Rrhod_2610 [Rhodococcus rhodnii LMG 5362]|uniref:Uncharacterized protein n=1 Tax=Rhodococcus rhodnii LMG 5362 TaxID=1273125 RepID=R7WL86_9NOCA|nr:hypothetical protein Rrhod_2610 [Rhodococcus rhodnii LMG 5362]